MTFVKDLLRNLALLAVIGLVLFLLFPKMMAGVFQTYGALFGPFIILILVVFALPQRKRNHRSK